MKGVLLVSSFVSLLVLGMSAYQENFMGDWRDAQARYRALLLETADSDMAREAWYTLDTRTSKHGGLVAESLS